MCLSLNVFANTDNKTHIELDKEVVAFLKEHKIDPSILNNAIATEKSQLMINAKTATDPGDINEAVKSLIGQTKSYNFTNEQINNYIKGIVNTPTTAVGGNEGISLAAINRPGDNGIGYEVKSVDGYYETTAFGKIPSVYRGSNNASSAYMFYTVKDSIDVGIWYGTGTAGTGWRYCWTYAGQPMGTGYDLISGLTSGKNVYFQATVVDNYWIRFRVLDAADFSKVFVDISVYSGGYGITRTNNNWNRQISLCNDTKDFADGAYCRNAEFSNAYIYNDNNTSQTISSNTVSDRVGAFGTDDTTRQQVTVNSYSAWYMENVSIDF